MAAASTSGGGIVPAQLGFLAIFNPSLGSTDETLDDQIVYYASISSQATTSSTSRRKRRPRARPTDDVSQEERHERLRQIGLAQGMVSFSRGFSDGAPVDAIDTQKSRVVAHEVEPGWWILASIDLNKVPLPPRLPTKPGERPEERFEYTTREMKPAQLLLQDLLRAHGIFLLHHDSSLGNLYHRCRRARFTAILGRYWDLFLSTWSVMLHGNPIRQVFGGINVAASGELGVGVGEEERGSGEREVLEGLIGRIEGLVDLVVSRFGEETPDAGASPEPWMGSGREPSVEDGVIFTGTGALSRRSLRDVAHWMEDLYTWGEHAYGVIESPTTTRRSRRRAAKPSGSASNMTPKPSEATSKDDSPAGAAATTPNEGAVDADDVAAPAAVPAEMPAAEGMAQAASGHERQGSLVSYLTLGYGSYWSLPGSLMSNTVPKRPADADAEAARRLSMSERPPSLHESAGHYLIGLRGEIEEEPPSDRESSPDLPGPKLVADGNSRTVLRTVHVELEPGSTTTTTTDDKEKDKEEEKEKGKEKDEGEQRDKDEIEDKDQETERDKDGDREKDEDEDQVQPGAAAAGTEEEGGGGGGGGGGEIAVDPALWQFPGIHEHAADPDSPASGVEKLRVVVYVNRPFMFTFLFRLRTDSLAWDSLYRSLHYQLAPLRRPLLASTKFRPGRPDSGPPSSGSIYDVVWDPASLTVHSTIPNIPDPYFPDNGGSTTHNPNHNSNNYNSSISTSYTNSSAATIGDGNTSSAAWSRADAVSTHINLLNIHFSTRARPTDLERTLKTSRGWWIVWTRIRHAEQQQQQQQQQQQHRPRKNSSASAAGFHVGSMTSSSNINGSNSNMNLSVILEHDSIRSSASSLASTDQRSRRTASRSPGPRARPRAPPAKEIYLIRRASDHVGYLLSDDGSGSSDGRLVQGIGVDTRRYVEELLSLF